MVAKRNKFPTTVVEPDEDLSAFSKEASYSFGMFWIVGMSPLITHAWSEKAKREMLSKQIKSISPGKEARDPRDEFLSSLYEIGVDEKTKEPYYGFPAMGFKNAILSVAHKDKGIPRTVVQQCFWILAPIVQTRPALAGAVCDMPLLRIYGSQPQMREDMVKIGGGIKKIANFAYRGQFSTWALKLFVKFNSSVLNVHQIKSLVTESGLATGIGEWRNEKKGVFGGYKMASAEEEVAWEKFAKGEGPLPQAPRLEDEIYAMMEAA